MPEPTFYAVPKGGHALAGQKIIDQQRHKYADGSIENTVQRIAYIGVHRGAEQHDAQHHTARLYAAGPEPLAQ